MILIEKGPLQQQFENLAKTWRGTFSGPAYANALRRLENAPPWMLLFCPAGSVMMFISFQYDRRQYKKGYRDAIESIVRCEDCKNNGECSIQDAMNWTPRTEICDAFCSYGERRCEND